MDPVVEWDVVVVGGINADYLIRDRTLLGPGMSLNGRHPRPDAPRLASGVAALATTALGAQPRCLTVAKCRRSLEKA